MESRGRRPMETMGRRGFLVGGARIRESVSSRVALPSLEWRPGFCATWVSAKVYLVLPDKRPGRDDPSVLAAWLQCTRTCPEKVGTSHPGRDPVTAHLGGHAGAPASPGPLAQPGGGPSAAACGVPPTTRCPTLVSLRKLQTPTGLPQLPYGAREPLTLRVHALTQ